MNEKGPDLGPLRFEHGRWRGIAVADIPLSIVCGRAGPDAVLKSAALDALHNVRDLEARSRDYLASASDPAKPWPELTLAAIEVLRAAPDWVRQQVAPANPAAAEAMLRGNPIVTFQFAIRGDLNVVDVILSNGLPVAWDYH